MPTSSKADNGRQMVLLRFDDICPTMNWQVWEQAEGLLRHLKLKPILAVVPDNRDPRLRVSAPLPDFWARVRQWQSLGWTIALHGYQHVYVNRSPGLMGITPQSEFAGLIREEQAAKLQAGLRILLDNGVSTDTWVAPAHSFDRTTLELLSRNGIRNVSDGLTCRPFTDARGLVWIPCQLWEEVEPQRHGVWTVCYHHNGWSEASARQFRANVTKFRERITSVPDVLAQGPWPGLSLGERLRASTAGWWRFGGRRAVRSGLKQLGLPRGRRGAAAAPAI